VSQTQNEDEIAVAPVVEAFKHYYDTQGSALTDGLISGLIAYKMTLDKEKITVQ
jgi:hypothetical protein